jgi:hypothetical protein
MALTKKNLMELTTPLRLLKATKDASLARIEEQLPLPHGQLAQAGGSPAATAPPGDDGERLAAEVWAAALRAGKTVADATLTRLAQFLKLGNVVLLVASVVSVIGGGTLIGLIAGDGSKVSKIIVAALTLFSTILTLVATFLQRATNGGSRVDSFVQIQNNASEAAGLAIRLEIWAKTPPLRTPLDPTTIQRAQELVAALDISYGSL